MKIVVLAGGTSTERDVSIVSGTGICQALRQKGHQAILVDVFCGLETVNWEDPFPAEYDVEKAAEYIKSFNPQMKELKKARRDFFGPNVIELCKKADFVFLGLHGANGEDGKLQAAFDLMGIPYTGTGPLSSGMAMDKGITKMVFEAKGVPTPKGVTLAKGKSETALSAYDMNYPVIVKPCCGGSSVGVCIANDDAEYADALKEAFSYEDEIVVEQFVKGREFSVAVVEGKAYPIIEIAPLQGFYDYKNKYNAGSTIETCPAKITPEQTSQMQAYAELGYKVLNLQAYGRLDFIMDENGAMYCLEANTLPGMTPTSLIPQEAKVLGIDYPELCEKLIEVSLKKYQ